MVTCFFLYRRLSADTDNYTIVFGSPFLANGIPATAQQLCPVFIFYLDAPYRRSDSLSSVRSYHVIAIEPKIWYNSFRLQIYGKSYICSWPHYVDCFSTRRGKEKVKMNQYIDLHMHSTFSDDGEFTPAMLVRQCKAAGVRVMSITDHNCVRGNAEARMEAEKNDIKYISGVEIDCRFNNKDFHLLGYGIDWNSSDFATLEEHILSGERKASLERLVLTRELGFDLSATELNAISNIDDEFGVWTGEVFAEVLLEKAKYFNHALLLPYRAGGKRANNPYANFYWDYYSQGKPCYVEVDFPAIEDAIDIIRRNSGKSVLAHPGNNLKGQFELFDEIVKTGIDGVEVFCSYHDEKTAHYFYEQALKHSLIVTCGSDYHGKTKPSVRLGKTGCWISPQEIEHQFW